MAGNRSKSDAGPSTHCFGHYLRGHRPATRAGAGRDDVRQLLEVRLPRRTEAKSSSIDAGYVIGLLPSSAAAPRGRSRRPLRRVGPGVPPLRVVFCDDNYLVREGVASLFAGIRRTSSWSIRSTTGPLLGRGGELRPDAVLTDIRMPPSLRDEGIVAARRCVAAPGPGRGRAVAVSEPEYAIQLLEDGVAGLGYLLKERVSSWTSSSGRCATWRAAARRWTRRSSSPDGPQDPEPRQTAAGTDRARARSARRGGDRPQQRCVAPALYMSERAVEKHIGSVFAKLGLIEEAGLNRRRGRGPTFLEATGGGRQG